MFEILHEIFNFLLHLNKQFKFHLQQLENFQIGDTWFQIINGSFTCQIAFELKKCKHNNIGVRQKIIQILAFDFFRIIWFYIYSLLCYSKLTKKLSWETQSISLIIWYILFYTIYFLYKLIWNGSGPFIKSWKNIYRLLQTELVTS